MHADTLNKTYGLKYASKGMPMSTEQDVTNSIMNTLREQGYKEWVFNDFCNIKNHKMIRVLLNRAYTETAERNYKNRHGIDHGLATAYNLIRLFELVKRDALESDYMDILQLSKEEVLFVLMTAGFIHDTGRFFDDAIKNHEEQINDAISILEKVLQAGQILSDSGRLKSEEMLKRVKELCLCHDKKLIPSGKVEIAFMKLADALDVGPHRVYTIEDKSELDTDEGSRLSMIFEKDKHPGRYFGPLSIENVGYEYNISQNLLEVTFKIKNYACAEEIKKVIGILGLAAHNGHDHVRNLPGKIYVFIETPQGNRHRLYPTQAVLARIRAMAASIPRARIPSYEYVFDIQNMNGDTDVTLPLQIKNVNNKKGIDSQTTSLGADFPCKWENIRIKWFEVTDSVHRELPRPECIRSEEDGLRHLYRIRFGRNLGVGETIVLLGKCRWNHFAKVMESIMEHAVATPTGILKMNIRFPEGVSNLKMTAFMEVKDSDGRPVYRTSVEPKKVGNRLALISEIIVLERHYTYALHWKFEKQP